MTALAARDPASLTVAAVTAGLMVAQQVGAKAARDSMFLDQYEAKHLPVAMIVAAGSSLLMALGFSRAVSSLGPQRIVPWAFAVSGGLFVLEWLLEPSLREPTIWLLYLHVAAFGAVVISGFWSIFSERFDPATARQRIARVGAGATLGGFLGAVGAERLATTLDVRATLLLLAALNLACALGARRLGQGAAPSPSNSAEQSSTLALLVKNRYLMHLALLVTLIGLAGALVDFGLKARADAELVGEQSLVRFFAAYYAGTALLTFVVQTLLTQRSLAKLGLAGTVAVLPLTLVVFSVLGAAVTRLWSLVLVRGLGSVIENSLYRSGYELTYTPIAAQQKRSLKTIIDVAFDRLGESLGGIFVLGIVFAFPDVAAKFAVALAAATATAALILAWRLHGGYVTALAESLRSGTVALGQADVLDVTTGQTLANTTMALDRERLLKEIAKLQRGQTPPRAAPALSGNPLPRPALPTHRGLIDSINTLSSADASAIRSLLEDEARLRPELGPMLIPLLAHREFRDTTQDALVKLAPRIVGQLHDALVGPDSPPAVRIRIPSVLGRYPHARSVRALWDGLADPRSDVRYRSGQALLIIIDTRPELVRLDATLVHRLVVQELQAKPVNPSEPPALTAGDASSGWADSVPGKQSNRKLEHAFCLLSLTQDRKALRLAFKALHGADAALRGTALEYLDNVLPESVKAALWPHLNAKQHDVPRQRAGEEALAELLHSETQLPRSVGDPS